MLAFHKHVLPFQIKGDSLAFNIRPLDTLLYTKSDFKKIADQAIDSAILAAGTTARPTRALASSQLLLKYLTVRGLRVTPLTTDDANNLFRLGNSLGFYLLDGNEIVYFGMFDAEPAKEIVFRVKLLLQNLHQAYELFENVTSKTMAAEAVAQTEALKSRIRIEVLISNEIDRKSVQNRISELTIDFQKIQWKFLTSKDLQERVDEEYENIGEI